MFEQFGVSSVAVSAYRILLAHPTTVPELEAQLGPDAAARALAELAEHGLLKQVPEPDGPVKILGPERAVDLLIAREEEALEARRQALSGLRDSAEGLVSEFIGGRSRTVEGLIEELRGPDAVRSRMHQFSRSAQRRVWSVNPGPALPPIALDAGRAMSQQSRARGVHSRTIVSVAAAADPDMADFLRECVAEGDEVRLHPDPPLRLLLVDEDVALVPYDPAWHGQGAYVLHGPALVHPLTTVFEVLWRESELFGPVAEPLDEADEARLRQVVDALAAGQKDEAIARRLGVSVRTVRRLISLAVERLGAESRFQAGVFAVRRGWVRP
ncbi:helix-turn-helix transcriptional regulator [Longispora urticae]